MSQRTLELTEEIEGRGGTQGIHYTFSVSDQKPKAFATAGACFLEGHYLLNGPEGRLDINRLWGEYPNNSHVFGVEHDFENARTRLYKRVRAQAKRIAEREGLKLVVRRGVGDK